MRTLTKIAATLLVAGTTSTFAHATPLQLDVYNAGPGSFHVNASVVYGETEAMVVDTGFTKADALRIAAKVLDSGKTLKTIFISQADPDYYFGAEVLAELFPEAKVITTPAVREKIAEKMAGKLAFWGPKMGGNAPVAPVLPTAFQGHTLKIDDQQVEIRGTDGVMAHRPYLWIPSTKTLLGNVAVYGDLHLWMADAQQDQERQAWAQQLEAMKALKPETVVPGHMKAGTELNGATINYSQGYLAAFDVAKRQSDNSKALIEAMTAQYPQAELPMALEIGAKVHMGEMKW
ncbi:MBL fold metallo-hydrolase [Photobacterium atrarenae]|uniref:MBL fold metallo-hydrolase n=1 Tax=Photobacterium atrarenae TaxID=865757 RepID=A0ABY5GJF3_9GAMM|nr:MBL fold metallo-hydrolase [Photobacterium atrarenae]UTV28839.1 MBL fold metallo-hydrolase [Photobacterium atrarenae]